MTNIRSIHRIIETHEIRFVFCKLVTYNLLLVFGHLGMTVESSEQIFYLSLALIVSGVGFLKPNISNAIIIISYDFK